MQRSERQRAASRANGQKAKGPTTAAGKAQSSKNAQTHGLTGKQEPDPNEAEYLELLWARLSARFDPTDGYQAELIQIALNAELQMLRAYALIGNHVAEMISKDDAAAEQERLEAVNQFEQLRSLLAEVTELKRVRVSIVRMLAKEFGFPLAAGRQPKTRLSTLVGYAQRFRGQRDSALKKLEATRK